MSDPKADPLGDITTSRVVIVAGKGGVGKTTVTAVLARTAARSGQRVLVVELDGKPTLDRALNDLARDDLARDPLVSPTVAAGAAAGLGESAGVNGDVRHLSASQALEEYLLEHGFRRIAKRLVSTGVIEVVGTAAPGIDDLVVLGRIKQLERSGEWDVIIVDGPAAGHAITMLTSAAGLRDAVGSGPVRTQADEVLAMLADPTRCSVVLVTLPETTPVNELFDAATQLSERLTVRLAGVVINAVDPVAVGTAVPDPTTVDFGRVKAQVDDARAAAAFRRRRAAVQQREIARVVDHFTHDTSLSASSAAGPLPVIVLPALATAALTPDDIDTLSSLGEEVHPRSQSESQSRKRSRTRPPTTPTQPLVSAPALSGASSSGSSGASSLAGVVDAAEVIVCCGSGGVGKTTTAAVIAREAARRGRKAVVVTIDPARRLADAMGLTDGLTGEPQQVSLDDESAQNGELWAMMLDTPAMLERVVRKNAANPAQAERIAANAFYQNMANALSGTQEYMASEALHELHGDPRFDLVVVDTPPSRNALDFLEAPGVLTRFLDHRLFKLLMLPSRGGLRVLTIASQPMINAIGRVVGSDVLADATAFFQAFGGMESGFRERAAAVTSLLASDTTKFVLVAAPQRDTVQEAQWFADQLVGHGLRTAALVINRMSPSFGVGSASEAASKAAAADKRGEHEVAALWRNLAELRSLADLERDETTPLIDSTDAAGSPGAVIVEAPLLAEDVHDAEALDRLAAFLFPNSRT